MQRVADKKNEDDDLDRQQYYFDISTEEAVSILYTIKKEGAFLLRKRNTPDSDTQPYALSIFFDDKVHHTRIVRDPNGQYRLGETQNRTFDSVKQLVKFLDESESSKLTTKFSHIVEWYKSKPQTGTAKKSIQENKEPPIPLDYLPYYLKNTKREEIERILEKIKENGVFFIRDSDQPKSPYEIFIYNKNYVYQLRIHKSIYGKYSVDLNDFSFDSIPEMVKFFNYEKIRLLRSSEVLTYLKIHNKYIQEDDFDTNNF